jgi:GNAT superfamily N-acetyltransferase
MANSSHVVIRPLVEGDLDAADRIFRTAFGTFLGLTDPMSFAGDSDLVRTRWRADPTAALAAEIDGELVGSNMATNWGSIGFFGPLTVTPARWDQGIARQLLDATMPVFDRWGTRHTGLFTFSQSVKHVRLYQRYGFWPRFLTAVMAKPVNPNGFQRTGSLLSTTAAAEVSGVLDAVRDLTEAVYPGLDLGREIEALRTQGLGDVVLVDDAVGLQAVGVCHVGAGTEAGGDTCFVKFGAVRPGPAASGGFERLVDACEQMAADRGATTLVVGANAGRARAWQALVDRGFGWDFQGIAMHRPNEAGYNTPDSFVIDDWR